MPDQKDRDNPLPGGNPPSVAKPDAAAVRATEKAEQEAVDRAGGTVVPNVPVLGTIESVSSGNPRPAGEARPSVEVPTYAPPEQAGPFVGVNVQALEPQQSVAAKKALAAEQRIAWFIQHQPFPLPGGIQPLQNLAARLHAARYQDNNAADLKSLAEQAETLFGLHNIPELPDAK